MSLNASALLRDDNEEESDEDDDDYVPSGAESDDNDDKGVTDDDEDDDEDGEGSSKKKKRGKKVKKQSNLSQQESEVDASEDVDAEPNEEELKKKADSLWAELCSDTKPLKEVKDTNGNKDAKPPKVKEEPKAVKTYSFAGEEVTVEDKIVKTIKPEPVSIASSSNSNQASKPSATSSVPKRPLGGLSSVLANLSKKPKISTLTKTQLDWQQFKTSTGLKDELDQHNRSKDGFLERQAFLQRSDLRQFEKEKSIREKTRLSK